MTAPLTRSRLLIRIGLVAGILVSGSVLVTLWLNRPQGRPTEGPSVPDETKKLLHRVRIVDAQGKPVPAAEVFVLAADGSAPKDATWSPGDAVLTLPASDTPRSLRVTARGYRTTQVGGVVGSREVVLPRGLPVQVELRDVPTSGLPEGVRILLRLKPANAAKEPVRAQEMIDLMDSLGAPGSDLNDLDRRGIGYLASSAQARAGILLPEPGTYHVHWGLIDAQLKTWYSLGDSCGRHIEVGDSPQAQAFNLAVTLEDLQKTIDGLAARVALLEK